MVASILADGTVITRFNQIQSHLLAMLLLFGNVVSAKAASISCGERLVLGFGLIPWSVLSFFFPDVSEPAGILLNENFPLCVRPSDLTISFPLLTGGPFHKELTGLKLGQMSGIGGVLGMSLQTFGGMKPPRLGPLSPEDKLDVDPPDSVSDAS